MDKKTTTVTDEPDADSVTEPPRTDIGEPACAGPQDTAEPESAATTDMSKPQADPAPEVKPALEVKQETRPALEVKQETKPAPEPEAAADDAPAVTDKADDGKKSAGWRRWLPRPLTGGLVLLVVAAVVLSAVLGWKLKSHNDIDTAGRQAMSAAQRYAVALTSIDSGRIDSDFAAVMDGATGDFKNMYTESADQLKPLLIEAKSVSKGRVVAAGVQSASTNQVVVMLFVDADITNVTNPTPRVDRNRILMTMDRVGDRWLASKVDLA